ncbi:MAG: hypothetical protein HYR64_04205 [Fimbriimonas ginsengisoli]|uniref:YncE family protein n=1 Tax=Fimbriimonas ginsengisoli TaxID=1005039 RepID=A0A931LRU8_FIMGI|nr:hypothetical protein [Fimbriimonas ginsengisoli]
MKVDGKPNGLAYAPKHRLLLAANVGNLDGSPGITVSFVDVAEGKMVADVDVPGRTRWAVYDSAQDRCYVNIADPAQILVFDPASLAAPISAIEVSAAGPHGLDLDRGTNRLFCACDDGALIALDLDSKQEVARAALAGGPDVVFVNEAFNRIYIAIGDPGVIQVFDTRSLALIETVTTEPGAHTIGFDSKRNKVYAFLPGSCRADVYSDAP